MIRKVQVIFRRTSVWSQGSFYESCTPRYRDGQIIFEKEYQQGYHMQDVWNTLRSNVIGFFFDIFYPAVVAQTAPPEPPVNYANPDDVLSRQSKHIQKRVDEYPQLYAYNLPERKWTMTKQGYAKRTVELGNGMEIGVAEDPNSIYHYDETLVEKFEKTMSGRTKDFVLFLYPDKYSAEVRSMFHLRVTFW
jgi:hypothetical protein